MNRTPLPAGTTLGKSHEYGLDVNLGTYTQPVWQPIRRLSDYAPTFPKVTTDAATYDDEGDTNEDVTGRGFNASCSVQANRSLTTGYYLPEVEAILAAAKGKGDGAVLDIRFYHKPSTGTPHPTDAGRVSVTVDYARANSGNTGIEKFSLTFAGKGSADPIPNPFTGWATNPAPKLTSVSPTAKGTGDQVTLVGSGFLTVTAVTFGATAATKFTIVNDATIVAVLPSGSAGSVQVKVTNPAGVSNEIAYTRAA